MPRSVAESRISPIPPRPRGRQHAPRTSPRRFEGPLRATKLPQIHRNAHQVARSGRPYVILPPVKSAALGVLAVVLFALATAAGSASRQLGAPRNVRLPKIAGSNAVGRTLSARRGTWAGRPRRFRFTWQRCNQRGRCGAVRGAHRRTYRLGRKDAGSRIRVVVTASNAAGSASAASASTRAVRGVVMVFDLGWDRTKKMPWSALTEADLFTIFTENGPALDTHLIRNINVSAWVRAAHAHGVKAFISIGGAGNNNWGNACNDTNRAQFVQNLVGYATSHRFDGIDLDIEDDPWAAQNPPVAARTNCIVPSPMQPTPPVCSSRRTWSRI